MDFYHHWVDLVDFYFKLPSLYNYMNFTTTGLIRWILIFKVTISLQLDGFLPPLGWFGGFLLLVTISLQIRWILPPLGWFGGF